MSTQQTTTIEMQQDLLAIRARAKEIAAKVRTDPYFVRQLVNDPKRTLLNEGLPAEAVLDILRGQAGATPSMCFFSCVTTDCCMTVSVCCNTGSC